MRDFLISDLAYLIKEAKENNRPLPIFFLGAGSSITGNIPSSKTLISEILDIYKDNPFVKKLDQNDKTYSNLLNAIGSDNRKDFINKLVDNSKINFTHLYLAQLYKNNFVDYILTVNFDNLLLKALALFNEFPLIYDLSVQKTNDITQIEEKSIIYLHGQYRGLWLLVSDEDIQQLNRVLPKIFDSIKNKRPWIFIGYSGSDPVFETLKNIGKFENGLFWVGEKDQPLSNEIEEFLSLPQTNAYYIKGHDADSFMSSLNHELGLGFPEVLESPFSWAFSTINQISEKNLDPALSKLNAVLRTSKDNLKKTITQYEKKELVNIEEQKIEIDQLKKEIINLIISEENNFQKINEIKSKASEFDDDGLNNLLAGLNIER